ncbi:hypothetical protein PoB_000230400 [Plakobranchus ocellatus]|uniref:Uncharacterized protein n=1 Tax=Plakobranchus ocellatus TaxID=259542 RepID=A0AAV3Y0Q2_9GAST|nr:hypothetical protein PoB_000230400 [Plakobranchus ocellatus]
MVVVAIDAAVVDREATARIDYILVIGAGNALLNGLAFTAERGRCGREWDGRGRGLAHRGGEKLKSGMGQENRRSRARGVGVGGERESEDGGGIATCAVL